MPDLDLPYGGDLGVSPSGDFALAGGDVLLREEIIRALATNSRQVLDNGKILDCEYLFDPKFGASLGRLVGTTQASSGSDLTPIENAVRVAVASVDGVSQLQPPTIQLTVVEAGIRILIAYTSAATNQPYQIALLAPN